MNHLNGLAWSLCLALLFLPAAIANVDAEVLESAQPEWSGPFAAWFKKPSLGLPASQPLSGPDPPSSVNPSPSFNAQPISTASPRPLLLPTLQSLNLPKELEEQIRQVNKQSNGVAMNDRPLPLPLSQPLPNTWQGTSPPASPVPRPSTPRPIPSRINPLPREFDPRLFGMKDIRDRRVAALNRKRPNLKFYPAARLEGQRLSASSLLLTQDRMSQLMKMNEGLKQRIAQSQKEDAVQSPTASKTGTPPSLQSYQESLKRMEEENRQTLLRNQKRTPGLSFHPNGASSPESTASAPSRKRNRTEGPTDTGPPPAKRQEGAGGQTVHPPDQVPRTPDYQGPSRSHYPTPPTTPSPPSSRSNTPAPPAESHPATTQLQEARAPSRQTPSLTPLSTGPFRPGAEQRVTLLQNSVVSPMAPKPVLLPKPAPAKVAKSVAIH